VSKLLSGSISALLDRLQPNKVENIRLYFNVMLLALFQGTKVPGSDLY